MTTYKYQGAGEYLPGIPARDLAERDVARLSAEQIDRLTTKGANGRQLYVRKSGDAPKAARGTGDATPAATD